MSNNKDNTTEQRSVSNQSDVVPRQGVSIIWFVPFIALIFGLWLTVKVVSEQGTYITIEFDNGSGIIPNKTEVRYKGLVTGLVKKVEPSEDLQRVIAEVEISKNFTDYLTQNTLFWLVSADISLQGVSGLDTLISGSYITILPDTAQSGKNQKHFIALTEAPTLDMSTPGLHLTLHTDVLGSISENSPINFKQIPIGHVTGYHYIESTKKIAINIFIKPEFAHLIKENSLFYNTSGVQVTASLTGGVKVNTDSLAAIMAGGISVDTLSYQKDLPPAKNGQSYPLHADFQAAEMGHEVELTLEWDAGIDHNAAILYQGLTIGFIKSFSKLDPVTRKITAMAKVNPRVAPYLTDQSQFYIVSPKIGLSGLSNAKALLTGSYISIRPSLAGNPVNKFKVFNSKPPYRYNEPGLHLMLNTSDRSSLSVGSSIYYEQQEVGSVQAIETTSPGQHVIHIHVQPEFSHYVTLESRFYNNSGVKVSASLLGVDINAGSLQSILSGGIAFTRGTDKQVSASQNKLVKNGDSFLLHRNNKLAEQSVSFLLTATMKDTLTEGTRILYRGKEVGAVHGLRTIGNTQQLRVGLLPEYQHVLTTQTQFYLVKPTLSLSGASDTDALLGGAYITFNPGEGDVNTEFTLYSVAPIKHANAPGLQLSLSTEHANAASPGSAVTYRGIVIGQVDNISLDKVNDKIAINITIDDEHVALVNSTSRFYNASGVSISGGLSDFVVKTESVDAILRGGISLYNPTLALNPPSSNTLVKEMSQFTLYDHIEQAKNAGKNISIHFQDYSGLKVNTKVLYQDQTVGVVERLIFNDDKVGVTALVLLNDLGSKYAKQGSKFWKVEPEIGLVGSKNVSAILDGAFIGVLPTYNDSAKEKSTFNALTLEPTIEELPYGLNIKLISTQRGSVRLGNPVLYRQIKVGKVIGVDLSPTADKVFIYINIAQRYASLVTAQSKFWNTSGIKIEAGLFSGVNINTESVETIIAGGIAFATPTVSVDNGVNIEGPSLPQSFTLFKAVDEEWLEWQPKILLNRDSPE